MKEYSVSCARMKILEQNTDKAGLSYYQMMENAGTIAANRIVEITMTSPIGDMKNGRYCYAYTLDRPIRVRVYCGKGNNGGDGLVAARLLKQRGWDVEIILVDGEPTTPDAIANYRLVREMGIPILEITETDPGHGSPAEGTNLDSTGKVPVPDIPEEGTNPGSPESGLARRIAGKPADVIVDAIYGTGFHGALRQKAGCAAANISEERRRGARVFALDIPSGMGGDLTDESELDERCVRADVTVTFHAKKPVHLQTFAKEYCGRIITADIGIVDPEQES